MQICMGMIGMRPKDFWDLSPVEMYQAMKGFKQFNTTEKEKPMTHDELQDLMELYPD